MKKIKVGFLIDSLKVNSYVYDLIQHVDKSNFFLAPVLIHGHHVKRSKYQQIRFLLNKLGFIKFINKLLIILLSKLIKRIEISSALKKYPQYLKNLNY